MSTATKAQHTIWPKFRIKPWPNKPARIISRSEALDSGFDERSIEWLENGEIAGTDNARRDSLSLYTLEDSIRAAAPELLSIARRWAALDAGAWHPTRYAAEKKELIADTEAAIAKAEGQ